MKSRLLQKLIFSEKFPISKNGKFSTAPVRNPPFGGIRRQNFCRHRHRGHSAAPFSRASTATRICSGSLCQPRSPSSTAGGSSEGRESRGTYMAHFWCSIESWFCTGSVVKLSFPGKLTCGVVSSSVEFCSGSVQLVWHSCKSLYCVRLSIRFPPPPPYYFR